MQSGEAPRRNAPEQKEMCCGWKESTGSKRDTSARGTSGAQPTDTHRQYHWHRNNAGNRPAPHTASDRGPGPYPRSNGDVERRREHQADSRGEQRCAHSPEHSVGPRNGHKTEGSVGPTRDNQADSGMGPRHGTGRPPGSAPWPENILDRRHPIWAVSGKDWLSLLPNTVEPTELDPPGMEERMEVDPPLPGQAWDYCGMSLCSAIREHQQQGRSAQRAPYLLLRLHRKH